MQMLRALPLWLSASALALYLSGCGGGGGGGSPGDGGNPIAPESFLVSTLVDGPGSISPEFVVVDAGSQAQFKFFPAPEYRVDSVAGCGGSLTNDVYVTAPITAECTVTVSFVFALPKAALEVVGLPPLGNTALFEATNAPSGVIFASTAEKTFNDGSAGVWRSTDGGLTWDRTHDETVNFISISSDASNFVLAGGADFFLISDDLGATWTRGVILNIFGSPLGFTSGSLHSRNDGLFMTADGSWPWRLYRSLDGGLTWPEASTSLSGVFELRDIQVAPSNPSTMYVLSFLGEDIWKSVDNGESFFSIKAGISTTDTFVFAGGIRVNPKNADQVFIQNHVSVNGGANWSNILGLSPSRMIWVNNFIVRVIEAGDFGENSVISVSSDAGVSWENVVSVTVPGHNVLPDKVWRSSDSLFFSSGGLIYRLPLSVLESALND